MHGETAGVQLYWPSFSQWFDGTLSEQLPSGSFNVLYDDGDEERDQIWGRLAAAGRATAPRPGHWARTVYSMYRSVSGSPSGASRPLQATRPYRTCTSGG